MNPPSQAFVPPQQPPQPQPQPSQQQQQQRRQQISMNDAISTLKSMFETVDPEVIRMILEACGGRMEDTIENLLQMSSQNNVGQSNSSVTRRPSQPNQNQQQINNNHNNANNVQDEMKSAYPSSRPVSVNLPDDFLRPPLYYLSKHNKTSSQSLEENPTMKVASPETIAQKEKEKQIAEDEIFTKTFQHDLFVTDLHTNPEWVLEESPNYKNNDNSNNNNNDNNSNDNNNNNSNFSWQQYKLKQQNKSKAPKELQSASTTQNQSIDPSDINARKHSFKQRFNTLTYASKARLISLAEKLQKNKQEKKTGKDNTAKYTQLSSLDNEPLIDDEDDHILNPTDGNQGTYIPPKPSQNL